MLVTVTETKDGYRMCFCVDPVEECKQEHKREINIYLLSFVGKNDFYFRTRLVFLGGFEDKSFSREYNHTSSPLCPSNHRTLHSLQVLQCCPNIVDWWRKI